MPSFEGTVSAATPEPIAIVGMECVFPGAPSLPAFWRNIVRGASSITAAPADRWSPNSARALPPILGGFIADGLEFDPLTFGIPPAEIEAGDPEQFLVLAVIGRALRDLRSKRVHTPEKTEIVLGRGGYISNGAEHIYQRSEVIEQVTDLLGQILPPHTEGLPGKIRERLLAALPEVTPEVVACAMPNLTSGRAANRLNIMGRNCTVDAACASSLIAVDMVVRSLRERQCDLGIAAAVHLQQKQAFWECFKTLGVLSPTGACRPFGVDADGLLMGEGVAAVVLKRLSDARRDGDRIYAAIRAVGVASDGKGLAVLTPRLEGESLALRRAYDESAVDPQSVGLIEAHGTATNIGDSTEIDAVHTIFGKEPAPSGFRAVALGSVKSMIGHAMPAAGIAGLIKAAMSVYNRVLPPTLHVQRAHPKLDGSRFYVNTAARPWISRPEHPRRAGVNAFGFGGINAHVILEDVPSATPWQSDTPHSAELFLISAASKRDLIQRLHSWVDRSRTLTPDDLADACFTESLCFSLQHPVRLAIVAKNTQDLTANAHRACTLLDDKCNSFWEDPQGIYFGGARYSGKLAFLFPGMGFPGLAGGYGDRLSELYFHFPEIRKELDLIDSLIEQEGQPLSFKLFPPPLLGGAERAQIDRDLAWSEDSGIGMSMSNIASWRLLSSFGLTPDAVAGFSLGEISALFAAEIIDPQLFNLDTVRHLQNLMSQYVKSGDTGTALWAMAGIGADQAEAVMRRISGTLSITIDVSPTQVFIGGDVQAVRETLRQFEAMGIWCQALPVLPFLAPFLRVHTTMADPLESSFRAVLETVPLGKPKCQAYSGTNALPYPTEPAEIREMILNLINRPVQIRRTIKRLHEDGVRIFIQLGSGGKMLMNIQNTLENLDHVALATDLQHRPGLEQLLHLFGHLATLGVPFDISALYRHRELKNLDRSAPKPASTIRLSLRPHRLHLPASDAEWIRSQFPNATAPPQQAAAPLSRESPAGDAFAMMQRFLDVQRESDELDHRLMHQFLETQQAGLEAFFAPKPDPASHAAPPQRRPLIGHIHHLVPGHELHSVLTLDLSTHTFLREHALINVPAGLKSPEERLPTLPLTFEIEIVAEAAETLFPDLTVTACHSLEARRWISLESSPTLSISIRARRIAPAEVEVELYPEGHDKPAFRGRASLALKLLAAPPATTQACDQQCPHSPAEFYARGPLFHGPMFQLMRSFRGMSATGIAADLVAGSLHDCISSSTPATWIFDPLLLDALQHIVGYRAWLDGWFTMPTGMNRISRFGPLPRAGSAIQASVLYRKLDGRRAEAAYEAYDENGRLWIRVDGLQVWRVLCPKSLLEANHRPKEGSLAQPWTIDATHPGIYRVNSKDLGDVLPEWIARLYLREAEWSAYRQTPRLDWLLGRIAAKDAVRDWVRRRHGLLLHPLEVEISNEPDGAPQIILPAALRPTLSIAHIDDQAIALVSETAAGVDLAVVQPRPPEFSALAFSTAEVAIIPHQHHEQWIHRAWCAKEAAVKAVRLGFARITDFQITALHPNQGTIEMLWKSRALRISAETWSDEGVAIAVVQASAFSAASG